MKKIFLKNYKIKNHIKRYSGKYFLAVVTEITAIIIWSIALCEIYLMGKTNPATFMLHIAGITFSVGSCIFAKFVKVL